MHYIAKEPSREERIILLEYRLKELKKDLCDAKSYWMFLIIKQKMAETERELKSLSGEKSWRVTIHQ